MTRTRGLTDLIPERGDDKKLIALGLDGVIVPEGGVDVPQSIADAVQDVIACGHVVVLVSHRPLTAVLPVAASCGMTTGWAITSGGTVTARITPAMPGAYEVVDQHLLDVMTVAEFARERLARVRVAVEEIGWGHHVYGAFPPDLLPGRVTPVPLLADLPDATPRLVLQGRSVAQTLLPEIWTLPVMATAVSPEWIEVTPAGHTTATALETLRQQLRVAQPNTIAVGARGHHLPARHWASPPALPTSYDRQRTR